MGALLLLQYHQPAAGKNSKHTMCPPPTRPHPTPTHSPTPPHSMPLAHRQHLRCHSPGAPSSYPHPAGAQRSLGQPSHRRGGVPRGGEEQRGHRYAACMGVVV